MKKVIKVCIVSILLFMLTGCGWDDVYKKHKKVLDKGVSCEYKFSKAENIDCGKDTDCSKTAVKKITLKADKNAFYVNGTKINSNIISLGSYKEVFLEKFDYNQFLADYEDSGECPTTISYGGMEGSNNTYLYYTNNSGAWKFIYTINKKKEEQTSKPNNGGGTTTPSQGDNSGSTGEGTQSEFNASCQSARAINCKQYSLVDTHDITIYVELGRQKTTSNKIKEYFVVSYNSSFEGASVVYKDDAREWPLVTKLSPSNEGYKDGYQTFYVTDEQFKLLFVGEDKYADKLYAQYDNMDLDNSPNYYLRSTPFEGEESVYEGGIDDGAYDSELPGIKLDKINCDMLFKNGNDYNATHKLLASTLRFMQYLGIILATILSVVDFIKVVPTNDKDALNKAAKKAVTRLVIAIVIFFVPIILNFILGLVGFNNPTCRLL